MRCGVVMTHLFPMMTSSSLSPAPCGPCGPDGIGVAGARKGVERKPEARASAVYVVVCGRFFAPLRAEAFPMSLRGSRNARCGRGIRGGAEKGVARAMRDAASG